MEGWCSKPSGRPGHHGWYCRSGRHSGHNFWRLRTLFEEDGVRYHHILDPDTGYPINNEILGISIITEKAIDGDALSTLVYAKGLEAGMDFVESLDGVDAIFVSRDKTIYLSSGAAEKFDQNNMDFDLYTSATKQK